MASTHTAGQPVDMIEIARETTKRDIQRQFPGAIKVISPAKVNLFLAVGPRRADGYHDVQNVLHAIMLHDVLYMRIAPDGADGGDAALGVAGMVATESFVQANENLRVGIACVGTPGVDVPQVATADNLAFKAVAALAQELAVEQGGDVFPELPQRMELRIEKGIPHQAGLAGGSSNAAAALVGAAQLWGLNPASPCIVRAAQRVGADVAFFLQGGCARYDGKGECAQQAYAPRKESIVLIKPEGGLSTADVYRAFDESGASTFGTNVETAAFAAQTAADIPLANDLQAPAGTLMPELSRVRAWALEQPGVTDALLCGSGSATFAVCDSFNSACKVAASAKLQGWWARTTSFAPIRAAVVPQR